MSHRLLLSGLDSLSGGVRGSENQGVRPRELVSDEQECVKVEGAGG